MKRIITLVLSSIFLCGCLANTTLLPPEVQSPLAVVEDLLGRPSPIVEGKPIHLLFAGDMMFDRSIRQNIDKKGASYILEPMHAFLQSYDLVIANLEGPITSNISRSVESTPGAPENYLFTFDTQVAKILKQENISVVNLGNNHIGNFGKAGVQETKMILDTAGVGYFGNTGDEDVKRAVVLTVRGTRIGLVNYNQFIRNGMDATLEDLEKIRKVSDVVVVYTHWGTEYESTASGKIISQAHAFIDHGAGLVIGSHPHVIQQEEVYKGKKIFYSLGNFIFDQYLEPETQKGLLVDVTIAPKTFELETKNIPIQLRKNGQTSLAN